MWGVFPQLALHTWINSGHCQNNAGEVGSQVSVHCHWPVGCSISMYLGMPCMQCAGPKQKNPCSCHWYEQTHLFCEINMMKLIDWQTAGVWDNEQSGSAKHCWPCVQVRWHIVLERVLGVFPTTKENSEFPKRRYWNSSMTWSEIVPKGKLKTLKLQLCGSVSTHNTFLSSPILLYYQSAPATFWLSISWTLQLLFRALDSFKHPASQSHRSNLRSGLCPIGLQCLLHHWLSRQTGEQQVKCQWPMGGELFTSDFHIKIVTLVPKRTEAVNA